MKFFFYTPTLYNSTEKEEKLDNVANGTAEDGWISPNRQAGSPRCSHSRQSSNASSTSIQYKRQWVDVITGITLFFALG